MIRNSLLCALALLLPALAYATEETAQIKSIPLHQCDWPAVKRQIVSDALNRMRELAAQSEKLRQQQEALPNGEIAPTAPATRSALAADNEFTKSILANSYYQLLESDRIRDIEVIDRLLKVADANYRTNRIISDRQDPDFIYQAILATLLPGITAPNDHLAVTSVSAHAACSVQHALFRLEQEPLEKIKGITASPDTPGILEKMDALKLRYRTDHLDRTKMSEADRREYDAIESTVGSRYRLEKNQVANLERIRALENASALIYRTGKQDLRASGGNGRSIGKSLEGMARKKQIDRRTSAAIRALRIIASKLPSEKVKEAQKINQQFR